MSHSRATRLQSEVRALLAPHGLLSFGWFKTEDGKPALLIGNIGGSLWPAFSNSPHFTDGLADSLDRWTLDVIQPVTASLGAQARYPFGETVWPFQQYARLATGMQQAPIGLLVHPEYGLWTAFRAAVVFSENFRAPAKHVGWHPCDRCADKPCLKACPVGAFSRDGYDYRSCRAHISGKSGATCLTGGCLARHACPVGPGYAYEPDQLAFHMAAFV